MNIQRVQSFGYKGIQYVHYTRITRKGPHMTQPEQNTEKNKIKITRSWSDKKT